MDLVSPDIDLAMLAQAKATAPHDPCAQAQALIDTYNATNHELGLPIKRTPLIAASTTPIVPVVSEAPKAPVVQFFENPEFGRVRVVMRGEDPWFVASDVATCLGYANPREAIRNYCKKAEPFGEPLKSRGSNSLLPENSGSAVTLLGDFFLDPQTKIIPESDLYRLIMRSHLPAAERFQDWVVEEVLPQIRKTGSYGKTPKTYLEALKALVIEVEAKEKAQAALLQEQSAHALTKRKLDNLSVVTRELLLKLGLSEEYRTVKSLRWLRAITLAELPTGHKADSTYWAPIGAALVKLCKTNGGFHLTASGVPCTYEVFQTRHPWSPVRIQDAEWGVLNVYPRQAIEAFKQGVMTGMYDRAAFVKHFRPDYKTLLENL